MASNFSIEEKIKYCSTLTRQEVLDIIDAMRASHEEALQKGLDKQAHQEDSIAWEQVGFARDLLDEIVNILKQETRSPKLIKERIINAISESMFEG